MQHSEKCGRTNRKNAYIKSLIYISIVQIQSAIVSCLYNSSSFQYMDIGSIWIVKTYFITWRKTFQCRVNIETLCIYLNLNYTEKRSIPITEKKKLNANGSTHAYNLIRRSGAKKRVKQTTAIMPQSMMLWEISIRCIQYLFIFEQWNCPTTIVLERE